MTLTADLQIHIVGRHTSPLDLSTPSDVLNYHPLTELTNGVGVNQVDIAYHDQLVLAASPQVLDLTGGLTDAFGNTLTFAKVKVLLISNLSTTATQTVSASGDFIDLLAGIASANEPIEAGGYLLRSSPIDGFAVTDGVADTIVLDPDADTITADVFILGTSS